MLVYGTGTFKQELLFLFKFKPRFKKATFVNFVERNKLETVFVYTQRLITII